VLAAVLSFVCNLLGRYRFTDSIVALATASFLFTTLIFLLGYVGLVQEFSVRDIENDCANDSDFKEKGAEENSSNEETTELKQQEQDEKNNDSIEKNTSREQMRWLGERISNLMEEEQVYLQHDLRIIDLAYRLNTNRTYIQRAILEIRKCSFSEYINQLRIDYADRLLEEHPEYAITEIAERSGYTSLSTFYRNYRSIRGRTPKAKQE
jgi:AraC-like DNA-binding protein